jgi:tetratricopeptide (TPR) repeat protein
MSKSKWAKFPHPTKGFEYAGAALAKNWGRLHGGDQEPFPDAARLTALIGKDAALKKQVGDLEAAAANLQDGWRAFHKGDFETATRIGTELGLVGATLANKASGIYATYLCTDEKLKLELFQQAAARAEEASKAFPKDANAHYFRAFALGRYSQGISIAKALAQGLGGKIKESLEATLKLAPEHAEAHSAMGLYHAEIISKIGSLIGGLTYGAKTDTGLKHLKTALELTPDAPVAHLEYGNGLLLLYGNKRENDAAAAYEKASQLKPADAMEKLDAEKARGEIE